MGIPQLITDMAIMMLTAGIIAIIFKKIKQPLVLGYILAGFLVSPYFPWFSTIVDTHSVETWSEIGIIFLMFHLGLEFNLHKMAEVGSTAIVTCLVNVVGMVSVGYGAGLLLGFSTMDSIVLGGMLSMSSTMVIVKVFEETGKREKYHEGVIGTLVMQDIVGIFMMVILSTISVSKNVSGIEVLGHLGLMLIYLVIWLILGILVLPTFLDKTIKYMNDEMLTVLSIGICLGMVLLANWLGFSSALGAFLSGSLLAGTVHVERIERLTKGIKDLFGAIFFISVGMMVNPMLIIEYIVPIIVIFVVTIVGKVLFNALGMIISGQSLNTAVKSGFALAQIGEFAFIIASLGNSLGVIDDFMYPIAVAVSVVTIFTTPICIKVGEPFAKWIEKALPDKLVEKLNKYTSEEQADEEKTSDWALYLKKYFLRVLIFGGIMLVTTLLCTFELQPMMEGSLGKLPSSIIALALNYLVIALLTRPLLNRNSIYFTTLWLSKQSFRLPLIALSTMKMLLVAVLAVIPIINFFGAGLWLTILVGALVILVFSNQKLTATTYLQLETKFLKNFNERLIKKEEAKGNKQEWLDEKLFIMSFIAEDKMDFIGETLKELDWGKKYHIMVVKVRKNSGKTIILPALNMKIEAGDKVYLVGEKIAIDNALLLIGLKFDKPLRTIKEFMDTGYAETENALSICPIRIRGDESFCNKPIHQSNIINEKKVAIIGIQKNGLPIVMPNPNLLLSKGDILWIMGSNTNVGLMISEYVDELEE